MSVIKVAMLHLDPRPGQLESNRALIEKSIEQAAASGARIVITPELAESGYHFTDYIGTDWIDAGSRAWLEKIAGLAARLRVAILLGTAERTEGDGNLYNTVFIISDEGKITGRYRKINIHRAHNSESWAMTGDSLDVFPLGDFKIGLLICADAWNPDLARKLAAKGADVIISVANWGESPCSPESCWEKRSLETGVPVWVCNRTGVEHALNFEDASSVVSVNGERLLNHEGPGSVILYFDWDTEKKKPLQTRFEAAPVN